MQAEKMITETEQILNDLNAENDHNSQIAELQKELETAVSAREFWRDRAIATRQQLEAITYDRNRLLAIYEEKTPTE